VLSEEMIYQPNNRELFKIMKKRHNNNIAPTALYISESIADNDQLSAYFYKHIVGFATVKDVTPHLDVVKRLYMARNVFNVCNSAIGALSSTDDILECVRGVETSISEAMASGIRKTGDEGYLCDYLGEYYETIQRQMTTEGSVGIPTGLKSIDNVLGGLKGGELITVAGRTGMGKSSLIATWIVHQLMQGYKPAIFTMELQRKEIVDKIKSMISEIDTNGITIPFHNLNNPAGHFGGTVLTGQHLTRMQQITNDFLVNSKMYIRGASKLTVEEGISICRKLRNEGNCDIAYFDHIGLMVQDKNNSVAELTNITGSLKLYAGEADIPIVEVVQLSRGADNASEKPRLSHCKGSGSIEEDSNIVIMPWRPYAINREGNAEESEIIVAKSRNTECG